jgi:hypothetical protein
VRRVAAAQTPLDERGAMRRERTLWRFQPGRLMPGFGITGQEARPRGRTGISRAQGDAIFPAGGIIWGKFWRMGCAGDSGTPWRGKTRSNKTRQRQGRVVWIMVPWPAVG